MEQKDESAVATGTRVVALKGTRQQIAAAKAEIEGALSPSRGSVRRARCTHTH